MIGKAAEKINKINEVYIKVNINYKKHIININNKFNFIYKINIFHKVYIFNKSNKVNIWLEV